MIKLNFQGPKFVEQFGSFPTCSGVYAVYKYRINERKDSMECHLIYIGSTENFNTRISTSHHRWDCWERELDRDQMLCFTLAKHNDDAELERVEYAMIYEHNPVCNIYGRDKFSYDTTSVEVTGVTACMSPSFTVYKDSTRT